MLTETTKIDRNGHILLPQEMLTLPGISPETEVVIALTEMGIVIKSKASQVEVETRPLELLPMLPPQPDREEARRILQAAGLLTELGPELRQRAESSTATLEEVIAAMDRAGGKLLSEIVLEQRRAKAW